VPNPTLVDLTNQASIAARAGQCTYVEVLAARVSAIDDVYRSAGFLADPAIFDCL
jgi:hypothetical protein